MFHRKPRPLVLTGPTYWGKSPLIMVSEILWIRISISGGIHKLRWQDKVGKVPILKEVTSEKWNSGGLNTFGHICLHFWAWLLLYSAITPKSEDKYVVKVFNPPEFHFSEVTFFQNWYFREILKMAILMRLFTEFGSNVCVGGCFAWLSYKQS